MRCIVEEYLIVRSNYLVEAVSEEQAKEFVISGNDMAIDIDVIPSILKTIELRTRPISQDDLADPSFQRAYEELDCNCELVQKDLNSLLEDCTDV